MVTILPDGLGFLITNSGYENFKAMVYHNIFERLETCSLDGCKRTTSALALLSATVLKLLVT